MFFDLTKLGNQFNEVIQKAKDEVEKSVDNALGIEQKPQAAEEVAAEVPKVRAAGTSQGGALPQTASTGELCVSQSRAPCTPSPGEKSAASATDAEKAASSSANSNDPGATTPAPKKVVKRLVVKKPAEKKPLIVAPDTTPSVVNGSTEAESHGTDSAPAKRPVASEVQDSVVKDKCAELTMNSVPDNESAGSKLDTVQDVAPAATGEDISTSLSTLTASQLLQLPKEEVVAKLVDLQSLLAGRDQVIHKQIQQLANLNEVVSQLQDRNQQLALRASSINEEEFEAHREEFEQRLATAERKVYALTKERDALKKGAEKISEYGNLLKEKDCIIKQVMEEGEKLSKKQIDLEGIIKKLRAQVKEFEQDKDKLQSKLTAEESNVDGLKKAKAKLERDYQEAVEQHNLELTLQKEQYEAMLQKARSDQADAEEKAREVAKEGLAKKLKEAETRNEAMAETIVELREALDRQRQAADLREEMLKQDIGDLERRCHAAELRHQELASKLPDATRPLLRQIEAMQAAAAAQAEAWAGAELTLHQRIADAEAKAAAAVEKERLINDRLQGAQNKQLNAEAALNAARGEVKLLHDQLELEQQLHNEAKDLLRLTRQQLETLQERMQLLQRQYDQLEAALQEQLDAERQARAQAESDAATVRKECDRRVSELQAKQAELAALTRLNNNLEMNRHEPPAMAAPGYRWTLVKEGEEKEPPANSSPATQTTQIRDQTPALGTSVSEPERKTSSSMQEFVAPAGTSNGVQYAAEVEFYRSTVKQKQVEQQALESKIRELELTRDSLAEELVKATQRSEQTNDIAAQLVTAQKEVEELRQRYTAAIELLGERDEAIEELRADITDMKQMYKEQVEFMMTQIATAGARPLPP